ncbi:MAG TPA: ribonuclease HII [Bacilli bacterium]|nr:ribonuclease HII [Bacilli bacterium]
MKTNYNLYEYENNLHKKGYKYIGGCDEAGRGPLYGPVVAACCVLPNDFKLEGLTDSKQLTEKKRDIYFDYIKENAIAYGIGIVDNNRIDEINIYAASREAMVIAYKQVKEKIDVDYLLTDAMPIDLDIEVLPIIKGDAKSITIAAASVLAKVTRDRMMYEIDLKYPEYGFKKHKGYPTKMHLEAINKYGLIDGYRKTYGPVKKVLEGNNE